MARVWYNCDQRENEFRKTREGYQDEYQSFSRVNRREYLSVLTSCLLCSRSDRRAIPKLHRCNKQIDEEGAQGCSIYYKDEDEDGDGVVEDSKCLCNPDTMNKYTALHGGDLNDQDPNNAVVSLITRNMELSAGWGV